jgi:hypothetical protein
MKINFEAVNFKVNETGELEYHGKVIEVYQEYFMYLTKEQKIDILTTLIDWANNELENCTN